ncbi:chromosomal replication initiator DnaA [Lacimonas salitolerans]|uniref:Chromosomal replication initiator DnaA n=1 Tax=Lacimonas salitolerans TaxID=1323750 RepID=A0ABW4EIZ1_9RHOB
MERQLGFDLPVRIARGRSDFFVSPANAMAVALIDNWRDWPGRKLLLTGPTASGKTHLAHVWAAASDAAIVAAQGLAGADIPALATSSIAVEDAHEIARDPAAQDALFHLHNLCLAEGHSLLITAPTAPRHWGLTLPDLASRMQGTPAVSLAEPDDELLGAVLMKLFADRQLVPTPDTLPYLVRWMTRSFQAARDVVAEMDDRALAQGRPLNRGLAREVLADWSQPDLLDKSGV